MSEETPSISEHVDKIMKQIQESDKGKYEILEYLSLEVFRSNLTEYIQREGLENSKKSMFTFVVLTVKVYTFVKMYKDCTLETVTKAFKDEDERLVLHALSFLAQVIKIGPGFPRHEQYNYPLKS